jgi:5-methylthioadenosine/S-adenosylhomocysteine deaminase
VTTTVIRNAEWVIAWNEAAGHHFYRRGIDIVFVDDMITFVGRNYPGAADRVIDGRDRLVLPGLIDIHSHPEHEPLYRGVRDPLRSFIYHAADRAVRDVFVGGRQIVADGKVLTLDQRDAAERVAGAQRRMMEGVPRRDYRGRTAEEITPLSLPLAD